MHPFQADEVQARDGRHTAPLDRMARLVQDWQANLSRGDFSESTVRSMIPALTPHQSASLPRYRRGTRGQLLTDRKTCRPASESSSAICAPDCPVPTTSTAPSASWPAFL